MEIDSPKINYQNKPTIAKDKLPYLKPGEKEIYVKFYFLDLKLKKINLINGI